MVRSKQSDISSANNLQITSWTNYDSSSISISTSSPPLILYTQVSTYCMPDTTLTPCSISQVSLGGRAVLNAKVSVSLQLQPMDGASSILTEGYPLLMTDNGFGSNYLFLVS